MKYPNSLYEELDILPGENIYCPSSGTITTLVAPPDSYGVYFINTMNIYSTGGLTLAPASCLKSTFLNEFKTLPIKIGDFVKVNHSGLMYSVCNALIKEDKFFTKEYIRILVWLGEGNGEFIDHDTVHNHSFKDIFDVLTIVSSRRYNNTTITTINIADYPHTCLRCGASAYVGAVRVECSKCGEY